MAKTIALSNQKGGVGKTTSTINFGSFLASMGHKVLLVDIDPQGNLSSGVGVDSKTSKKTTYELILHHESVTSVIQKTDYENLDLIPSNINLSAAELDLLDMEKGREYQLKENLDKVKANYDYILIDCPPSLGLLTINALCASDSILIVLQCEYYALEGLSQLVSIIQKIQNSLNSELVLEGVLLTMFDSKTNLSKQVRDDVVEFFGDKVFESIIPRNIKLSEAPSYGQPINVYDSRSSGAQSYADFSKEFLKRQ